MIPGLEDVKRAGEDALHDAGRRIALSVTAGILGGIAAVFACAGVFLGLAPMLGAPRAAFATAGVAAFLAALCALAMRGGRRHRPPPRPAAPPPRTQEPGLPLVLIAGFVEGFLASRHRTRRDRDDTPRD